MKTTNPDHPIRNTLKHFAAAVAVAGGLLAGTALAAPANNDFANAIDLPGLSGTQTGTNNIDATLEGGETSPNGETNTVWFTWTAPASGDFTYGTLGSTNLGATEWDAVIGIYTGSAVNALTTIDGPKDTTLEESMTVPVLKGTTYYIQLAGYGGDTAANLLINWNFVPVNNDNFARAIALTGVAADQTGDIYAGTQTGTGNAGATLQVGEPDPGDTKSVWFKWTCPADGEFNYGTLGSTNVGATEWDAIIAIYTGATVDALTTIGAPKDTTLQEDMTVDVYSGVTYYIQLAGYAGDTAENLLINWTFVPDGPPVIVNSTPPDGSTTSPDSNLVLTFNKPIAFSSGNITIKDLTTPANDRVMSVDPSLDPQLSISGRVLTINPTTDLVEGNLYAVQIDDTAIIDTASQEFAGILDNTTLNFTAFAKTLTTTTVVSSGSPSIYGNNVTFTATVVPAPSGGTVQFKNNGSNLGAPASVNTSTGVAIVTTSALGVAGPNVITAVYSSNFQFEGSTSGSISQVVTKAGLTVTAQNVGRYPLIANPTLPYLITGFMNAQTLGTSGVTGTAALSTTASSSSPIGDYPITPAVGTLAASNYDFTSFVDGTLTVVDPASPIAINVNIDGLADGIPFVQPVLVGPVGGLGEVWNTYYSPYGGGAIAALQTHYGNGTAASGPVTTVGVSTPYYPGNEDLTGGGLVWGTDLNGNGNVSLNMLKAGTANFQVAATNRQRFVITGLNPAKTYDLHIASANCLPGQQSRGVWYTANTTSTPGNKACDNTAGINGDNWVLGNNYVFFEDVVPDVLGKITIDGYSTDGYRLPLNGFQLVEVPAADDYAAWATANGATTAELDHDNDGVENGVEYFMGETGSSFTAMNGLDATNTIIWPASATYEGTYEVQTSPDLVTWTNVSPKPVPSGGNLSYTLPTGSAKLFLRLLVTPTP
jgi:hypothetical protein